MSAAAVSVELAARIRRLALDAGLDAVGITDAAPFPESRRALEAAGDAGRHAGMSFTFKNPARSTEPARLLRGASSLVVGALGYLEPRPTRPPGAVAAVARYAWRDHYAQLRTALTVVADALRVEGHRAVVIADQNGLVDRAAAHRAGIGWWGRNTNLLMPGSGSWFVLGSVVTDAALPSDDVPLPDGCRTCTRCVDGCPTGAIDAGGSIDARRCLAWLVQDTGPFPRAHRIALGDRIYGCDDCQDVCPPGQRDLRSQGYDETGPAGLPGGQDRDPLRRPPDAGDEPDAGEPDAWVSILDLLDAGDEQLLDTYGRWYVPRRQPRYLRRNALVVLGNVGDGTDATHRACIQRWLEDDDDLLRAHAVWAAARLGLHDLVASRSEDPSPLVRAEVALAPTVPPAPRARPAPVRVRVGDRPETP